MVAIVPVVLGVPATAAGAELRTGDLVTAIGDRRLSDGLGGVPRPPLGASVRYDIRGDGDARSVAVRVDGPISSRWWSRAGTTWSSSSRRPPAAR